MNVNSEPKPLFVNQPYLNDLFYDWFVKYNPLYFLSALCFLGGVFLASTGMRSINWIDGQVLLTGVIELYQLLLIACSFILFRKISQTRPAVILAIMNIFFLFDCTYQTEHISSVHVIGGVWTVFWITLLALKLKFLTIIFRLKVPVIGFLIPIFAATGIAGAPYLFYYTNVDKSLIHLLMTWYGVILAALVLWFRPTAKCKDKPDLRAASVLRRAVNAAWLIWGGFYLFHLISWIRFFDIIITPANVAPLFILLAFASRKEAFTWAGCIITVLLSAASPSFFWLSALLAGMVFFTNGWVNRQSRLYIGAILGLHFLLATAGWETGPIPYPAPWLCVLTGIGLMAVGWFFRRVSAFLIAGLGLIFFLDPRGPSDIIEWGSLFIAIGYASLFAGVIMNWKFRFVPADLSRRRFASPPDLPDHKNFKKAWQPDQDQNGASTKIREESCPHCKFNMKSGNDKCDACGRDL